MGTNKELGNECLWNQLCHLPPVPFKAKIALNQKVKHRILQMREILYKIRNSLSSLHCLHAEAATLSRFLYRNYNPMKKDKGYQMLKMMMTALNKYLKLEIVESIDQIRTALPLRFLPFVDAYELPTQAAIGWLLAKFQGMAALFYRIYHLTKRAGMFIYQRLRLFWSPAVLVLSLGLSARIHVISKYLILQIVNWHSSLIPLMRCLHNPQDNLYKEFPKDLKVWLGGLDDLVKDPLRAASALDLVFQLVDLTKDDDDDLVKIIKDFSDEAEDDEVRRIYEMVDLETPRKEPLVKPKNEDDLTVILSDCESEDVGELVSEKNREIVLDESNDDNRQYNRKGQLGSLKRKRLFEANEDDISSVFLDHQPSTLKQVKRRLKGKAKNKSHIKTPSKKIKKKNPQNDERNLKKNVGKIPKKKKNAFNANKFATISKRKRSNFKKKS